MILLHIIRQANPSFHTDLSSHRTRFSEAVIDVGTQCVQWGFAVFVLFGAGKLGAAEAAAATDLDSERAHIHRSLNRFLHGPAETDAALELHGDVLRH